LINPSFLIVPLEGLLLYKKVGEEYKEPAAAEKLKEKAEAAEASAKVLETKSAEVKKLCSVPPSERKKSGQQRNAQPTKVAPPEKKAKVKTPSKKQSPFSYIGQRVAKFFGDDVFFGTIKKYIEPGAGEFDLWHIVYDDDDQEDFDSKDLRKALNLYKQRRSEDKASKVDAIAGVDAENQAKPKPSRDKGETEEMEVDGGDGGDAATTDEAAPADVPEGVEVSGTVSGTDPVEDQGQT
jgi:hypothetical protein